MPRIGTPRSYTAGSRTGAPSTCTLFGPPLRINPAGRRAATPVAVMVDGTISEYTESSRTRRAMSWAYWAPKSTTRTACWWLGADTASVKVRIVVGGGRNHLDAIVRATPRARGGGAVAPADRGDGHGGCSRSGAG